ncbi:hypothetical protein EW145_g5259 [Phellinidium pouzarii]|uniref:Protein YOP1 n=1 Tax=Phellinidium pouzarii TaxID=167371 RepID=A0A4S4L0L9_9AGAM|nr:hypothetical protein EW145_g5259 [Phellinidium pouzarii]
MWIYGKGVRYIIPIHSQCTKPLIYACLAYENIKITTHSHPEAFPSVLQQKRKTQTKIHESGEARMIVTEQCPNCGYHEAYSEEKQMRSADEGTTILYTMSAAQKVQQHPAFQQATNKANYYVNQLDKELSKYPVLQTLEQRTQVPKTYAVIGSVFLLGILLLINSFAAPVSNLVGWALPAYLSFKAIESPGVQDDVQWLTYWVVFGFFNFLESFALRAVLYYFPWYFAFKTVFVLWLQLPAFRGAQTTYHTVLKPVLANVSSRSPAVYQPPTTASADGLRERVNTATTD